MQTEVYEVSSLLGLCTVLALLDRECRGAARRVLIISINTRYPEVDNWYRNNSAVRELIHSRFDRVVELHEEIFPVHPTRWEIQPGSAAHRRRWLGVIDVPRVDILFLESLHALPSRSLAQLFEAELHVYSHRLTTYSPTPARLPKHLQRRMAGLVYVDYLQGAVPLLLDEIAPQVTALSAAELRPHVSTLRGSINRERHGDHVPRAIFVGQALSDAGVMIQEAEVALYVDGLRELSRIFGGAEVSFKPHPHAPVALTQKVRRGFRAMVGHELAVTRSDIPIELGIDLERTDVVAGVFSTALFSVPQLFGIRAVTYGTKELISCLRPYERSERIPAAASDFILPSVEALVDAVDEANSDEAPHTVNTGANLEPRTRAREFRALQIAIGYYMQPKLLRHRKAEVKRLVATQLIRDLDFYLAGRENRSAAPSARHAMLLEGIVRWLAKQVLDERKMRKLDLEPERFFQDSRVPGAILLGRVYLKLTGKRKTTS